MAILKELTEYLSKKGELQQLEVLKNYLDEATRLITTFPRLRQAEVPY
ncbi:MAG: hypothetical protein Q8P68_00685 [Candidatus Peregrinibacteria bacterium]|nr:hypothetical protein [Candidatus Peregrinibacteria bacterium]MDZ4245067.1 hypothetical protein [Candidatus Gracilibacteria bacterium]